MLLLKNVWVSTTFLYLTFCFMSLHMLIILALNSVLKSCMLQQTWIDLVTTFFPSHMANVLHLLFPVLLSPSWTSRHSSHLTHNSLCPLLQNFLWQVTSLPSTLSSCCLFRRGPCIPTALNLIAALCFPPGKAGLLCFPFWDALLTWWLTWDTAT